MRKMNSLDVASPLEMNTMRLRRPFPPQREKNVEINTVVTIAVAAVIASIKSHQSPTVWYVHAAKTITNILKVAFVVNAILT